ncbi:hypothetical protein YC2023_042252 [Brassica napus]
MWSAMHMFYKRSLCDPSPYHSQRIAFLDQWVVTKIVSDFKEFNPKTWKPTDTYKCIFNGTYPSDRVTNKKWLHDIDHLYACHFVNGNHWVALDIDLGKETITVYDSILTLVDDKEIQNFCRPFAKMIPSILSTMVSATVRKKSEKQFTVRRLKKVPQNDPPGDCGVYTIKYIECLAIGCTFEGLRDETIQDLRRKLAAEIYDSVGEPQITHLFTDTAKSCDLCLCPKIPCSVSTSSLVFSAFSETKHIYKLIFINPDTISPPPSSASSILVLTTQKMENNCDLELRLFPTSSYDESDTSVVESRSCGNSLSKEEESQRITIFYSERMCVFSNVTHLQAKSIILIASREIEERSSSNGSDPQTEKISPKFSSETEDSNSSSFTVPSSFTTILALYKIYRESVF